MLTANCFSNTQKTYKKLLFIQLQEKIKEKRAMDTEPISTLLVTALLCLLAFQNIGAAQAESGNTSSDNEAVVHCHDPGRGIVQKSLRHECRGKIVSEEEAKQLRRREKAKRLGTFRDRNVEQESTSGRRFGTGFFVTEQGHIVTAKHVVHGCQSLSIHGAGYQGMNIQLLASSSQADLAILKSGIQPSSIIPVTPADAHVREGTVTALGYPNLGRRVIRPVDVDGPLLGRRTIEPNRPPVLLFQATVHPGNSGGPLLDQHGRLIGVVIATIDTGAVFSRTRKMVRGVAFAEELKTLDELMRRSGVPLSSRTRTTDRAAQAVVQIQCDDDR